MPFKSFVSYCFLVLFVGLVASSQLRSVDFRSAPYSTGFTSTENSPSYDVSSTQDQRSLLAEVPEFPTEQNEEDCKENEKDYPDFKLISSFQKGLSTFKSLRYRDSWENPVSLGHHQLIALYILFHSWKGFITSTI